ncbi:MAG: phosphate butyryltransferase [Bacteroidales bacterium]|jgi:phosphate butyryltransferase|nr:phosphate butyryltransferase [Bacteroidales bacterium]
MHITHLEQIFDILKNMPKKHLVAAYANDVHTIEAISAVVDKGLIDATLVGDTDTIKKVCDEQQIDMSKFKVVQESDETKAGQLAVTLINSGSGDMLMKGLLSTDKYMRAILDKEKGLMPVGGKSVLFHIAVLENPSYHKLLLCSDMAIIPSPDLKQKMVIIKGIIKIAKILGIETPKIAILAATEQVSPALQACIDGALLAKMSERGQFKGCVVDGPLSLDLAIDAESAKIKKVGGIVAGDADGLVFPNIEAGNVFYKMHTKFNNGGIGAIVMGARVPCILTSRGDSMMAKMNSIALAALCS